jgi:hypothetical protein
VAKREELSYLLFTPQYKHFYHKFKVFMVVEFRNFILVYRDLTKSWNKTGVSTLKYSYSQFKQCIAKCHSWISKHFEIILCDFTKMFISFDVLELFAVVPVCSFVDRYLSF